MNRNGWIGKVLLVLAVVVPIAGFAASIYLASTDNSVSIFPGDNGTQAEPYVLTAADFPDAPDIGNQVGYQIPEFTLELADGSSITSSGMVEGGRPTYLFFWATV